MAISSYKRLFLSCVYLGVLFLAAGTAYYYLQRFTGAIFLLPGASESLVFCPADGAFRLGAVQRAVEPDLLLFDNPRSAEALRPDLAYDGLILPFALRLDNVEVVKAHPPRDVIHIEGPGEAWQVDIAPGARIMLGNEKLEIGSVGPWAGLVRDARGEPMAAVEVPGEAGAAGKLVFLESGRTSIVRPDLSVCFLWHASEAEARRAFVPALEAVAGVRWGVREDKAIQWLENLAPGTGLVLRDGTQVSLAEASREAGYITLQIQRSVGRESKRVMANSADATNPFIYEDPAATGRVFYVHAWRENAAHGRLLQRGGSIQEFKMTAGSADGAPLVLKQVMSHALAVPGDAVRAAQVRLGDTSLALREGSAETLGDYRLRYQMEPVAPEARYRISALDPQGGMMEERALEGGDSARIGAWVFALSPENPFAPHGVALTAVRRPGGLGQAAGLALFVLGSFGLVVARFSRQH